MCAVANRCTESEGRVVEGNILHRDALEVLGIVAADHCRLCRQGRPRLLLVARPLISLEIFLRQDSGGGRTQQSDCAPLVAVGLGGAEDGHLLVHGERRLTVPKLRLVISSKPALLVVTAQHGFDSWAAAHVPGEETLDAPPRVLIGLVHHTVELGLVLGARNKGGGALRICQDKITNLKMEELSIPVRREIQKETSSFMMFSCYLLFSSVNLWSLQSK